MTDSAPKPDESSSSPRRAPAPPPPSSYGRYRALARLGRGGMADVYVAAAAGAAGVKKLAVIKRLRADLVEPDDPDANEAYARFCAMFRAEAQLSAQLNHPNIVHTYDVGEENGALFIAMEYVEGPSLYALVNALSARGERVPLALAVQIGAELLAGLHYAHELRDLAGAPLGIVHRDVSPQNVLISYDGVVKLLDFGVAKGAMNSVVTEVGTLKGKVRYMAPEQVSFGAPDGRADVFAVGVILWELISGKRLVRGQSDAQALLALVKDEPPSLEDAAPHLDNPALASVIMRALQRDPALRFASARAMRDALLACEHEAAPRRLADLVCDLFGDERARVALRVRQALAKVEQQAQESGDEGSVADWGGAEPSLDEAASAVSGSRARSSLPPPQEPSPAAPPAEATASKPAAPGWRGASVLALVVAAALVGSLGMHLLHTHGMPSSPRAEPAAEASPSPSPAPAALEAAPGVPTALEAAPSEPLHTSAEPAPASSALEPEASVAPANEEELSFEEEAPAAAPSEPKGRGARAGHRASPPKPSSAAEPKVAVPAGLH